MGTPNMDMMSQYQGQSMYDPAGAATTPKLINKSPGHTANYAISPAYNNSPMPHMKQSAQYDNYGGSVA